MNVVGLKEVPFSSLRLPGDFKKRSEQPHVQERAASIASVGLIHEPLVRRVGKHWEPIAGIDRIAAHHVAGKESIRVKVVECTDEEARRIRLEENIQRRHDAGEQSRLALELLQKFVAEETTLEESLPEKPKEGAKTRARKRVAAELGISPETVRKKEWEASQEAAPKAPSIRSLGMTLSVEFSAQVAKAQQYLEATEALLKRAQSNVTTMANDLSVVFPKPRLERLREEIHSQAAHVRGLMPVSLCPWCKGLDAVQEHCSACFGTGFITKSQEKGVPKELLDEESPVVMQDGKMRPIEQAVALDAIEAEFGHDAAPTYAEAADLDLPRSDDPIAGDEPLGDDW
jgi:ParB-like chromosome segregation protein Spo0J